MKSALINGNRRRTNLVVVMVECFASISAKQITVVTLIILKPGLAKKLTHPTYFE